MFWIKIKRCNSSNGFQVFLKVITLPMVFLDQTWRVYKSKTLTCISIIFSYILLQPLNLFEHLLELLLLLPLPKAFWVFWFPNFVLSKKTKVCYSSFSFSCPFAKKNSPRTNHLNSFCVSLLPFPKEWRTNRLNSFGSPFSLFKEFKTTQSENSFDSSLSLKQKISKD